MRDKSIDTLNRIWEQIFDIFISVHWQNTKVLLLTIRFKIKLSSSSTCLQSQHVGGRDRQISVKFEVSLV